MFLTFVTLIAIQSIVLINAESFLDLSIEVPKGNFSLQATLTDISSGEIYILREFISSNSDVQGKIEIVSLSGFKPVSKADSSEVHYPTDKSNQRLVVQGNRCDLFSYKSGWNKKLPGINKPLLNVLLLMGPSVLYRISNAKVVWNKGPDYEEGDKLVHSATATMDDVLKLTNYYTTNDDEALARPTRMMFEGTDPGAPNSQEKESLFIEIDLYEELYYDLTDSIKIPSGIQCPRYSA